MAQHHGKQALSEERERDSDNNFERRVAPVVPQDVLMQHLLDIRPSVELDGLEAIAGDDDGPLAIRMAKVDRLVVVDFGVGVKWMAMDLGTARTFIRLMTKHVSDIENQLKPNR